MTPYCEHGGITIYQGDALTILRELPAESIHCCVTSPPYWGLRDYGTAQWEGGDAACDHRGRSQTSDASTLGEWKNGGGQIYKEGAGGMPFAGTCGKCGATRIDAQLGLERTPEEYITKMVEVFREVRRALRGDGVCFINIGDSYFGRGRGGNPEESAFRKQATNAGSLVAATPVPKGCKPKDLVGIPWMLAFALRADGWWLRQDIIWSKPNPMPESVTDRCTNAHEYLFLLSKSARYYFDAEAIREPNTEGTIARLASGPVQGQAKNPKNSLCRNDARKDGYSVAAGRNKRSVWEIATQPFPEAHFATFPEDLVKPCILAGCPSGGTVLDPFGGSMTTMKVARDLNCRGVAIELSAEYIEIGKRRLAQSVLDFQAAD